MLSFAAEWAVAGNSPGFFHWNNLLLHLICTLLVYRLARRLGLQEWFAGGVALAFGIHPMHLESVAWITERKDVLMGVFYLASVLSYMRYKEQNGRKWLWLSLLWFGLALLSKIQAVSLPLSLILIDLYQGRRLSLRLGLEKVPYFIGSLVVGILGVAILQAEGYLDASGKFSVLERLALAGSSLCQYIWKSIVAEPLSLLHPYPSSIEWMHWLGLAGAVVFVGMLFLLQKWWPHWTFGGAFFLVNIVFVLQAVGAGNAYMADRFSYLPYIGLFFGLAMQAQISSETSRFQRLYRIAPATFCLGFAIHTSTCLPTWTDSQSIWDHAIATYPDRLPLAYVNRGNDLRLRQLGDRGLADFNKAIAIAPSLDLGYLNRGDLYLSQGMPAAAMRDYDEIIRLRGPVPASPPANPNLIQAIANRGAAYGQLQRFPEAVADLDIAIRLLPGQPSFHLSRAQALIYMGRWQDALIDLDMAIRFRPDYAPAYLNRSLVHANLGNLPSARDDAQEARRRGLQIDPEFLRKIGL